MRKLVVLVVLMVIAAPANAQTTLGLRGGVDFATVSIEEAGVEEESVSRIVAGMNLGIRASGVFSLRLSGAYAQKGGGGTAEGLGATLSIDYLLATCEVLRDIDRCSGPGWRPFGTITSGPGREPDSAGFTVEANLGRPPPSAHQRDPHLTDGPSISASRSGSGTA